MSGFGPSSRRTGSRTERRSLINGVRWRAPVSARRARTARARDAASDAGDRRGAPSERRGWGGVRLRLRAVGVELKGAQRVARVAAAGALEVCIADPTSTIYKRSANSPRIAFRLKRLNRSHATSQSSSSAAAPSTSLASVAASSSMLGGYLPAIELQIGLRARHAGECVLRPPRR